MSLRRVLNKKSMLAGAIFAATTHANAFVISPTDDVDTLVDTLLIPGSGITVTSSSLSLGLENGFGEFPGDFDGEFPDNDFLPMSGLQSGTYTNPANTYNLPGPGIVLSSGFVENYGAGPNTETGFTGDALRIASAEQNALLTQVTSLTDHFDPVQLSISFDVDSSTDTVSFFGAFGSEEWPEFVGGTVTDGFGLFLNGENVAGALPTGGEPGVDPLLPINIDHPDLADIPGTELDGVLAPNGLPVLRFDIPVEPGSTGNVFEIILADAGDSVVDTTVYISSFGDFSSDSGASEFTPVLPSNPEDFDGGFVFDLPPVVDNQIIWIDPDVSTGYTYTATGGGLFDVVVAPSILSVDDPDGYTITYVNDLGETVTVSIAPGESYTFSNPVIEFILEGIDPELMLDPTDPTVFVTGLSFSGAGQFGVIQDPITTFVGPVADVSEPAAWSLLGVAGLMFARRRKSA